MNTPASQVSKNRLGGEPCPKDLEVLLTHCGAILQELGVEISGDLKWTPKTGQVGSITQPSKNDPHVQKTTQPQS